MKSYCWVDGISELTEIKRGSLFGDSRPCSDSPPCLAPLEQPQHSWLTNDDFWWETSFIFDLCLCINPLYLCILVHVAASSTQLHSFFPIITFLLKIKLILYGWNSLAQQFEVWTSLAHIHSDGAWNEHIHLRGLLLVSQDKSQLSHQQ